MKRIAVLAVLLCFPSVAKAQCTTSVPCSLFTTQTPASSQQDSGKSYEMGVRFFSDVSGSITSVRFYKPAIDTAKTHTVNLWSSSGAKLGTASTTSETNAGWQIAAFASPVAITASTQYVASYGNPSGAYSLTRPFFQNQYNAAPLHAVADSTATPNDAFASPPGTFPTTSFSASNYFIDVLFVTGGSAPPPPGITIGMITIAVGPPVQHSVSLTWQDSDTTVTGYNVYRSTTSGSGYAKLNASSISPLTFTDSSPAAGTTYFYVVTAVNANGESGFSSQVTAQIPSP